MSMIKRKITALLLMASVIFSVMFVFCNVVSFAESTDDGSDYSGEHFLILNEAETETLTDDQTTALYNEMEEAYKETGYSIYIIITDVVGMDTGYESYMSEISSYFTDKNKILLFISIKDGEHVVCIDSYDSDKNGASYFLDSERLRKIKENIIPDLSAGNFYDACHKCIEGISYYSTKDPKFDSVFFKWYTHLIVALVIALIFVFVQVGNMGGKITVGSRTYINDNDSKIIGSFDRYTHTTRRVVHHERSSGGGGGGGGHSSSGGSSF
ncbi:MAG: TPM domain-containing protein [Lachnospiraceae bacterium]|nr:TPM domain-containing protein [Lachnospiraceae bacterium]